MNFDSDTLPKNKLQNNALCVIETHSMNWKSNVRINMNQGNLLI